MGVFDPISEGVSKGMEFYLGKKRYTQEQAALQKLRDLQQEQIKLQMELARTGEARTAQEAARQEQLWSPGGPEQRTVPGAGVMTGRGAEYTTQKPAGLLYQGAQLGLEQTKKELSGYETPAQQRAALWGHEQEVTPDQRAWEKQVMDWEHDYRMAEIQAGKEGKNLQDLLQLIDENGKINYEHMFLFAFNASKDKYGEGIPALFDAIANNRQGVKDYLKQVLRGQYGDKPELVDFFDKWFDEVFPVVNVENSRKTFAQASKEQAPAYMKARHGVDIGTKPFEPVVQSIKNLFKPKSAEAEAGTATRSIPEVKPAGKLEGLRSVIKGIRTRRKKRKEEQEDTGLIKGR